MSPQHTNAFHGHLLFSGYLVICEISVAILLEYDHVLEQNRHSKIWNVKFLDYPCVQNKYEVRRAGSCLESPNEGGWDEDCCVLKAYMKATQAFKARVDLKIRITWKAHASMPS